MYKMYLGENTIFCLIFALMYFFFKILIFFCTTWIFFNSYKLCIQFFCTINIEVMLWMQQHPKLKCFSQSKYIFLFQIIMQRTIHTINSYFVVFSLVTWLNYLVHFIKKCWTSITSNDYDSNLIRICSQCMLFQGSKIDK